MSHQQRSNLHELAMYAQEHGDTLLYEELTKQMDDKEEE
jgi:hypothetical protein|tara:strand:- start:60 stop:176 length:117 start_codon:yes stop_codon:yes gene_type:complete